jgi:hypothetical protein
MGFEISVVRGPAQALRSSLVRFDMALQPTDLILELSARPLECIIESEKNVCMPLVQTGRTPDTDLLSVRERHADIRRLAHAGFPELRRDLDGWCQDRGRAKAVADAGCAWSPTRSSHALRVLSVRSKPGRDSLR